MIDGSELYQQAKEEIPTQWYETSANLIAAVMAYILLDTQIITHLDEIDAYLPLISSGLVGLVAILDRISTHEVIKAIKELKDKHEVEEIPIHELNPFVSKNLTSEELNKPRTYLIDAAKIGISYVMPAVGLAFIFYNLLVIKNNRRKTQRLNYLLHRLRSIA
ncbi:MAG TPA: hypothetical protein VD999_06035 [Vitreimonas sp.]|nr:hypothetical protein [Vitreimonas sp.]